MSYIMVFVCGLATALFLVGWLDASFDGRVNVPWDQQLGTTINSVWRVHDDIIQTRCPYCQRDTLSLWCGPCQVYYCRAHNSARHDACATTYTPAFLVLTPTSLPSPLQEEEWPAALAVPASTGPLPEHAMSITK